MFPGVGTLINGVGVLVVGLLSRLFFKKSIKNFEKNLLPLGLLVLALGLRESLKSPDYVRLINFEVSGFIFTIFAVIIGALIGNYLQIENQIKKFGDYLYNKFEDSQLDQSKFIDSYISTTLIVITGPLAIIGPFFDVVESNLELLLIKTLLDCFLVIFIGNFKLSILNVQSSTPYDPFSSIELFNISSLLHIHTSSCLRI